jgi:hypothetical protein
LESDNAELKFIASRSEYEVAEHKARAAALRSLDSASRQQSTEKTNQQHGASPAKAVVSAGAGAAVSGSPVVTREQQPAAKIEIANDEEDVRAYAKVSFFVEITSWLFGGVSRFSVPFFTFI